MRGQPFTLRSQEWSRLRGLRRGCNLSFRNDQPVRLVCYTLSVVSSFVCIDFDNKWAISTHHPDHYAIYNWREGGTEAASPALKIC